MIILKVLQGNYFKAFKKVQILIVTNQHKYQNPYQ